MSLLKHNKTSVPLPKLAGALNFRSATVARLSTEKAGKDLNGSREIPLQKHESRNSMKLKLSQSFVGLDSKVQLQGRLDGTLVRLSPRR
jgi:hypothetical protein